MKMEDIEKLLEEKKKLEEYEILSPEDSEEMKKKIELAVQNSEDDEDDDIDIIYADDVDFEIFNITNMDNELTGVKGNIYITSARTNMIPFVRWSEFAGSENNFKVSIEDSSKVFDTKGSQKHFKEVYPSVKQWVDKNKKSLMWFWNEASEIPLSQVISFEKHKLKKI